jgi:hypothetical protein
MTDPLEAELKNEIERISRDIDAIIKKVEEICPRDQGAQAPEGSIRPPVPGPGDPGG